MRMMKKHAILTAFLLTTLALLSVPAFALDKGSSAIGAGLRMHSENSEFTELPYGDDDLSYLLAWEGHEDDGYWQIAVDYAPDVSGNKTTDYILTPQMNLIWKDRMFIGGIGGLQSYVHDSDAGSDWTDFYWQLTLGLRLPVGAFDLAVQTYYDFDQCSNLDKFEGDDLEYGAWRCYKF